MPADIETRKCSIDTMAVTIQALHVSGKQMTLAVFRQLPTEPLFDALWGVRAELRLWGLVRYQGEWVVADRDGVLVACPVGPDPMDAEDEYKRLEHAINSGRRVPDGAYTNAKNTWLDAWSRELGPGIKIVRQLPQLFIAV